MRALVTGAGGGLGTELLDLMPDATGYPRERLSILDASAVRGVLAALRPEVVFNCAAYNAVDRAEAEPAEAVAINQVGPGVLAGTCAEAGARLVHFSTNYVFDGTAAEPYSEADKPAPVGVYARSKRGGERAVADAMPEALIVRSAGLFGATGSASKGGGFPQRILARAWAGESIRVVDDQRLNPTHARDLAAAAISLVEAGEGGLVHLVADGCCTWHEFASEVLRVAGVGAVVEAIGTAELGGAAPRPANGCLRSVRVAPLRHWREGLRAWWEGSAVR